MVVFLGLRSGNITFLVWSLGSRGMYQGSRESPSGTGLPGSLDGGEVPGSCLSGTLIGEVPGGVVPDLGEGVGLVGDCPMGCVCLGRATGS